MKIRPLTAIAGLLLGATACTPQEAAFWQALHAERPAEAEALLNDMAITAAGATESARQAPRATQAPALRESEQVEARKCPDGYVAIESIGGPLCVGAEYLDPNAPVAYEDPATCEHGYYQGVCVEP